MYIFIAIILLIAMLIGIGMALVGRPSSELDSRDFPTKTVGKGVAFSSFAALILCTLISSAAVVDARAVGIETAFGKYQKTLPSGLNWTAPWSQVESFSTLLQATDLNDFDNEEQKGDAVVVSFSAPRDPNNPDAKVLAGGGDGTISAIVNWQISESTSDGGAKALWAKYRTFDAVSTQLVRTKAMDTISDVANDMPANEASVNQTAIGEQVKVRLGALMKPYGIIVQDVSIRRIVLNPATASALQKINDAIAKTAAATEEAKAAAIQNQILKDRAAAGALEQKANDRYCLDIVNTWKVAENGTLPATFNCGLGSGSAGVLVQSK